MGQPLNFPGFEPRTRQGTARSEIFDPVRRKFVALTPEEWVRQHLIHYLHNYKHVPLALIGVEKKVVLNHQLHRFDLVVFSKKAVPVMLAECKAPGVQITENVFDQAARYNMQLRVDYFLITNGFEHYSCRIDYLNRQYVFIPDLPDYSEMNRKG